jgi:hypothetical protein
MRLISWNMARMKVHWRDITRDNRTDIALLQEAVPPPTDIQVAETVPLLGADWFTVGAGANLPFCAAIARLSDRVRLRQIPTKSLVHAGPNDLAVSQPGTLAACEVIEPSGEIIVVASMYGAWRAPIPWRKNAKNYADASVHRLISDLSALVPLQRGHKIIAAGDLNILRGYGENGSPYWRGRYDSVFARMSAIGLAFVGPRHPHGEQASPWPRELPKASMNVPTYRTRKLDASTATRQLDFVFASPTLVDRLQVRACNRGDEWGPSDHCRVEIELLEK